MRRAVAQVMEVGGAGAVVASVYLEFGVSAALGIGGTFLIVASLVVGR